MIKIYTKAICLFAISIIFLLPKTTFAQNCNLLTATYVTTESRCAATGTVLINATGGSGTYQYKATGPVATNYTSSNLITGLSAGRYLITVNDVVTNCVYARDSVTIDGDYTAPNFTMVTTDVTCLNGSDGTITVTSETYGRAPFSYKIIAPSASSVGTVSTSGVFTGLISGSYLIQLSDSCGAIQTRGATIQNYDWFINNYTVTRITCDSVSVVINLKDSKGNVTPNAVFNGFLYGASVTAGDTSWYTTNSFKYFTGKKHVIKLFVKDNCGNMKTVTWTNNSIPKVDATVLITNKACSTFTATITGQVNLTAPQFCIYDTANILLSCNSTGIFNGLPYGSYCIKVKDTCYDTTITRCFTVARPVPSVGANVNIITNCKNFSVSITGQSNLNNPYYCLYDSNNVLLTCDSTGIFIGLPFGRYCIKIFNDPACYDTTIIRCFTVNRPVPYVGPAVTITNLTCTTFTAIVGDTSHLTNPQFCLYTAAHVLIICNSTGIFDNLPYGTYCIDVINDPGCYDTTITRCFTVNRPIPSVGGTVAISNKTCTDFTATITGQVNVTRAQYCIYNSLNVLLSCNTTGVFTNLLYGSYCIRIQNNPACYDTLITRCFTVLGTPASISLSAKKSCVTLGATDLKVTINSGTPAYTLSLFSPAGVLIQTVVTSSSNYTFVNIPGLAPTLKYKIVLTDQCGNKDSAYVLPTISVVNRVITVTPKCPSGIWANGSADILVNITNNNIGGNITPKIIKKDGSSVSINPSSASGYSYTFLNLGPATYIFDTYIEDCSKHVYDTVVVRPYVFPVLSGSNAYQCDNNSFSVSVNVTGGVGPYTYEIIGSIPASPSIVTPPQSSPVFSINNGTIYSLIRLRVIDGCGNASLYDVSVLPLGNFLVFADSLECFNHSLTLRVDSIANAVYTWYKRIVPNDSVMVGTGPSLYFPSLSLSDTGRYFCKIVVNNGCLVKYANYILTGFCGFILPADGITLSGIKQPDGNQLYWNSGAMNGIKTYSLEKSAGSTTSYKTISAYGNTANLPYTYLDKSPDALNNYYRLKLIGINSQVKYSNTIVIKNTQFDISIYPNPVENILFIAIKNSTPKTYLVEIRNATEQKIMSKVYANVQNTVIEYPRNAATGTGIYSLTVTDLQSNDKQTYKLVYK